MAPPDAARHPGLEPYLAAFAGLRSEARTEDAWHTRLRQEAIDRFAARGLPTTRDEAWRYTNLNPLLTTAFDPRPASRPQNLTPALFEQLTFQPWDCAHLVFLDGRFAPDLSRTGRLPEGVRLLNLAAALSADRDKVEPAFGRVATARGRALTDLNTALMTDGLFLHVARGIVVEEPIHALFVSTTGGTPAMSHPRNLVVLEEGAQASIVESYAGLDGGAYLTNAVTEVVLADHARLEHVRLERESAGAYHMSHVEAALARSSVFVTHSVSLGGALVRHDVDTVLDGEGAECSLNGLYVLDGRQHVDNHTLIDHARPHGTSRELYKGVLDGQSRGIFDGTIIVRPDAQKTDARQTNRNLLLSEEALADTKPTLQIYADDVRCNHAATIGQIDEEALFYLRSRAISEEVARGMLIRAFVSDILGRINIGPLRAGLECLLFTRLPRHHPREAA
ncbi:MAG TPA: Fe-S cluster assembly protein SufD [Patescibacteria group bacterium]|nr:Fe-S cluster assembly protein SufD [Patescibacteria group bacterium]